MRYLEKLSVEQVAALSVESRQEYFGILEEEMRMSTPWTTIETVNDLIEYGVEDEETLRVIRFLDDVLRTSPGLNVSLLDVAGAVETFGTGFQPTDEELLGALYALKFRVEEGMVLDCDLI